MSDSLALLKQLRAQIAEAEAGIEAKLLTQPLRNPLDYAIMELQESGIEILESSSIPFVDIFWTRTGAKGIRHDMHILKVVVVKLPEGGTVTRCGFGYFEAVAVHGDTLFQKPIILNSHER